MFQKVIPDTLRIPLGPQCTDASGYVVLPIKTLTEHVRQMFKFAHSTQSWQKDMGRSMLLRPCVLLLFDLHNLRNNLPATTTPMHTSQDINLLYGNKKE